MCTIQSKYRLQQNDLGRDVFCSATVEYLQKHTSHINNFLGIFHQYRHFKSLMCVERVIREFTIECHLKAM